ncbi:SurA N-terminal domain-containing protein [Cypionkella sp.]|jgi:peptidyl-prolyl cis-trans isomerase D|uniref:peptidylprolyl isomerase n=1 Tax=Cypionkella sp. TaxID=2811411 RepID=UPI002766CB44|nr:SurA N-terminal domain-containing protein [Cypionkella sp.]
MAKAPQTDDETPKKKRRGASVMAWILMAMLIGGLGGFGVTNFGGGASSIGAVGAQKISAEDYARALRTQMSAMSQQMGQPLTFQMAQAFGLDKQVLQSVIDNAALDNEAARIGLSVGDKSILVKLNEINAFKGLDGKIDPVIYDQVLKQNNLTKAAFEAGIRADTARQLLQTSVGSGLTTPATLIDTVAAWAGEQRGFSLLVLREKSLPTPLAEPDAAALQAYYTTYIADYTRPEAKRISYAALLPDDIAADMPVDDAKLQQIYQSRLSEFVIPEKRLVERLGFATEADAAAAKARIDAGTSFETLVQERKLTLADVDLGDVSQSQLGDAGAAVFAMTEPGVVGPLNSTVGPALFRMNAILAKQETTFEQAKPDLAKELQTEAAVKAIADKVNAIDDALAGGASLADLAKEQGLSLSSTDYAAGAEDNDPITADKAFVDAAAKLAEGDYPQAILLSSGGVIALQLDSILPPAPRAFDSVKDQVTTAARAEALAAALSAEADRIKTAVEAGSSLGSFGIVSRSAAVDRQTRLPQTPNAVVAAAFEMQPNDLRVIQDQAYIAVLQLNSITAAPSDSEALAAIRAAIDSNGARSISDDVLQLYTRALTAEAGISLDQSMINAVNAQITN